ncbi:MAG: hypothetical protein WDN46_10430 [Methylocella sp.]
MGDLVTKASGNEAALNGIKQSVVEHLLDKFVPETSAPRVNAMRDFLAQKADVLQASGFSPKELSDLDKRAAAVSETAEAAKAAEANRSAALKEATGKATAGVKAAQEDRADVMSKYEQGVVGKLVNANGTSDILDTIKGVFFGTNPTSKMADLVKEAKGIGALDALHKAINEMMEREFTTTREAGSTGAMALKEAPFQKFVRDKVDVLKAAGLSDQQIGKLSAIVADQQRAARSINLAKLRGQSATTPDAIAALRAGGGHSVLTELALEEAGGLAAGAVGHAAAGVGGGLFGGGLGVLGVKMYGSFRNAGLTRMNEIRLRAALDPEFAKTLLEQVPRKLDTGPAALIALRARQNAVAGGGAGARQE